MVEHDHIDARFLRRLKRLEGRGAAIDGDDQLRAVVDQLPDGLGIGAIALEDAVGNVDFVGDAERRKKTRQQCGGNRPVDIVVAEDRNALPGAYGSGNPPGGLVHRRQRRGIGHQVAQGWRQKTFRLIGRNAASGEHPCHDFGNIARLADCQRLVAAAQIQPVGPAIARQGLFHVQKSALIGVRHAHSSSMPRDCIAIKQQY